MIVLGLNAFHGDASAALVVDGVLVAAAEEERFNRIKHCAGLPTQAVRYCLAHAGIGIEEVDHIAISRDPSANLIDKVRFTLTRMRRLAGLIRDRLANVARVRDVRAQLATGLDVPSSRIRATLHNVEHHQCHMASAYLCSPFEEAAVLSVDGFGDFVSTMLGRAQGSRIEVVERLGFPHSLGIFYTMVTQYLGFTRYGDEGKVMGLAPYGRPRHLDQMSDVLRVQGDGTFELGLDYFRHHAEGVEMTWDSGTPVIGRIYSDEMIRRFGPPRTPGAAIESRHEDIAASLQESLENAIFALLGRLHRQVPSDNLALAGGVALNSVANGKIMARTPFRNLFVQPAAGDAGTAVGAALWVSHVTGGSRERFRLRDAFLGPGYTDSQCARALREAGLPFSPCEDAPTEAARRVASGEVVGWFQGRMEFGPRALGNRSILADPRRAEMKNTLNSRVKHREPFRPFAPALLVEKCGDYFEDATPSPFMLLVHRVRPERADEIAATTHVDGTGRLQTVAQEENPRFHCLLSALGTETGTPVVLNTSFNENEPIVCTPADAIRCWQTTKMDALFLGDLMVVRS